MQRAAFLSFRVGQRRKNRHSARFQSRHDDPATIRRWWQAMSYNIAIATGIVSRVWVLDVDGAFGAAALVELEAEHGPLPATLTSVTASGCHLWFACSSPFHQASAASPSVSMFVVTAATSWRRHPCTRMVRVSIQAQQVARRRAGLVDRAHQQASDAFGTRVGRPAARTPRSGVWSGRTPSRDLRTRQHPERPAQSRA